MFGSIAILKPKEGREADVLALLDEWWRLRTPKPVTAAIAAHVFRLVERPDELMVPVVFESRESFEENSADPAQSYWHRRLVALLREDPVWIDGEVLASSVTWER